MELTEFNNLLNSFIGDPSCREIKQFGEVFTPIHLIEEMLDKLPTNIWTKYSLKWLDFACGIGSFGYCIYQRLMVGLKKAFPDETERKKHILENMIYFNDIRDRNISMIKLIFSGEIFRLNIYQGDFLTWNAPLKFDVIIGNPPYQIAGTKSSGHALWPKFVSKILTISKENGYISLIHPAGWRAPSSQKSRNNKGLFRELCYNRQMIYLEIHNSKDGTKNFKCGTRYDWYLIHNRSRYQKIVIKDELGVVEEIDPDNWEWFPNCHFELLKSLLAGPDEETCRLINDRCTYSSMKKKNGLISERKDQKFIYPLVHGRPNKFLYTHRNDLGLFGIPKVIIGDSGKSGVTNPLIDNGTYGMTEHAMAIQYDTLDEAQQIKEALMSKQFEKVLKACSWSNFQINWMMFRDFKREFYLSLINKTPHEDSHEDSLAPITQSTGSPEQSDLNVTLLHIPARQGGYTVKDLKDICKKFQLKVGGKREDLVKRITHYHESHKSIEDN